MLANRFLGLFSGFDSAFGRFYEGETVVQGRKRKGRGETIKSPVSLLDYEKHLSGEVGLGIIPLRADDSVSFAAIDIDVYQELDHQHILSQLRDTPFIATSSKSGGVHLYVFFKEPVPAEPTIELLKITVASLGLSKKTEIFPKQIRHGNNVIGNWINLPYFGDTRIALEGWSLEEFLNRAEEKRTSLEELQSVSAISELEEFKDGPPCLQRLTQIGFPEGSRNNALFDLAVFAKRKHEGSWESFVHSWNLRYLTPGTNQEVENVIRSLKKKDYTYRCKEAPICDFCEKNTCQTRKFGIGEAGGIPGETATFKSLVKRYSKNSVRWILDVDGAILELSTDDLFNQKKLRKLIAERLLKVIEVMTEAKWAKKLSQLMSEARVEQDPDDASEQGQFEILLDQFLTGRAMARHRDELHLDKCWLDTDTNRVYFKSSALFSYLAQKRFPVPSKHGVWLWVEELGGVKKFWNLKGKGLNTWGVPAPKELDSEPFKIPSFSDDETVI